MRSRDGGRIVEEGSGLQWSMRVASVVLVAAIALPACSSSTSRSSQRRSAESSTSAQTGSLGTQALKSAALAWAHAFLTGGVMDQYKLQGPECLTGLKPTPSNIAAAEPELQQWRAQIERRTGMTASTVQSRIAGVSVRNVGKTTAEAEVRYDLPVAATGNDNWVTYELVDGKWKVRDCKIPFGGNSSSRSRSTTTT